MATFAVQMRVRTAVRDSHSSIGVTVPTAVWRLVWALASLKDAGERIRIAGFYDDVKPPTAQEEVFLHELPAEEEDLPKRPELSDLVCGVRGYDYQRSLIFEQTWKINSISGGDEGKGMTTVTTATARPKLDFRPLPHPDPPSCPVGHTPAA